MSDRPAWPISRAAAECGVSRDTIKRRRTAGGFPNAYQDDRGQWLIPITDLLAAGLHPGKPSAPEGSAPVQDEDAPGARPGRESELEHQVALLQVQLDAERQLRSAAERNADDLRMSLRMLETAAPAALVDEPPITPATSTAEPAPRPGARKRRRWFSR